MGKEIVGGKKIWRNPDPVVRVLHKINRISR
jgi:hypothetical protein